MLEQKFSSPTNTGEWYALRVLSRHEKLAATALTGKGYQAFLPLYRRRHQYGPRTREVELPLFGGYVFCQFNLSARLPVLTTPGVIHIVGNGRAPVAVNEHEMASLRKVSNSNVQVEPCDFLAYGERVRIAEGALKGVEGVLQYVKNSRRLVLSVTLLQRAVQVEVERHCVERCSEKAA